MHDYCNRILLLEQFITHSRGSQRKPSLSHKDGV